MVVGEVGYFFEYFRFGFDVVVMFGDFFNKRLLSFFFLRCLGLLVNKINFFVRVAFRV